MAHVYWLNLEAVFETLEEIWIVGTAHRANLLMHGLYIYFCTIEFYLPTFSVLRMYLLIYMGSLTFTGQ